MAEVGPASLPERRRGRPRFRFEPKKADEECGEESVCDLFEEGGSWEGESRGLAPTVLLMKDGISVGGGAETC